MLSRVARPSSTRRPSEMYDSLVHARSARVVAGRLAFLLTTAQVRRGFARLVDAPSGGVVPVGVVLVGVGVEDAPSSGGV
jgi:hypothetical protein